tara:strand:- start:8899 stop:9450 length:552 start_codon:yes stop_codon:yes gene_type:complete
MVVEILAGIALVKSAVGGIKSVIESAKDINEISHHLDDMFKGHDQAHVKSVPKKKGNKKWGDYLSSKFKDEDEDVSMSQITAEIIEQKQIAEQVSAVAKMLNKRFGPDTWVEVLELREKRIKEQIENRKKAKASAAQHKKEDNAFYDKLIFYAVEFVKLIAVLGLGSGAVYIIWANRCVEKVC